MSQLIKVDKSIILSLLPKLPMISNSAPQWEVLMTTRRVTTSSIILVIIKTEMKYFLKRDWIPSNIQQVHSKTSPLITILIPNLAN